MNLTSILYQERGEDNPFNWRIHERVDYKDDILSDEKPHGALMITKRLFHVSVLKLKRHNVQMRPL